MAETILIVDDDPVQRRLLEGMATPLRLRGHLRRGRRRSGRGADGARRAHRLRGARPGDARSRRLRRARAHARRGRQCSGDRSDRPWRDRQGRLGDARRCGRFRRQAGRGRAPAGLVAQRAVDQRARDRIPAPEAQPRRHAHVPRHHHPQCADAERAAHRRKGRGLADPGADRRRVRRRQGADRARRPRLGRTALETLRGGQLRRDPGKSRRVRRCSATRRVRSPARPKSTPASSSKPRAARCSSTRSANCRRPRRSSCCAPSRRARSIRSAAGSRSRSMCASSRRPTAT